MSRVGEETLHRIARNIQWDMKVAIQKTFMSTMTNAMAAPDPGPFTMKKLKDAVAAIGTIPKPIRFVESEHALAFPKAKPHSDDMRDMIEHFYDMGLVERKPCALQVENVMYVHPVLMRKLRAAGHPIAARW